MLILTNKQPTKKCVLEILLKYFTDFTDLQLERFHKLGSLYKDWNEKINVISRKDIQHLYERHILHSLAIGKFINFTSGTSILDVGTGGGLPGIPLAILFPQVNFYLIDSIGKKIKVVSNICEELKLKNVTAEHVRVQDIGNNYDFIVSRAVTNLPDFIAMTKKLVRENSDNKIKNGLLYLKGGDFQNELSS
ncbi:MAG: 16S rRNA (guanine(527)-N(7))-methyltransferase RsmG, partial [Bacteroidetes bacterium]|nr:16S rRNA (guanine(527)-N(7))-methyltransferase RsmG [Bacteroidota bacterium]